MDNDHYRLSTLREAEISSMKYEDIVQDIVMVMLKELLSRFKGSLTKIKTGYLFPSFTFLQENIGNAEWN